MSSFPVSTVAQLKQFVVEEFHKIPRTTLDKWLEAYWERIEECYVRRLG